ncbi:MICOS complex subunit MIC26 [Sceloporus undulatus]|uniref:MICOS complex subunit MIC26 n=1 Tax=Sceloporus undulatus TaxID=8520 RepID=UPI001C4B129D|nr:MICOS complex subunit MIC26 [Sceloporus undulatus]
MPRAPHAGRLAHDVIAAAAAPLSPLCSRRVRFPSLCLERPDPGALARRFASYVIAAAPPFRSGAVLAAMFKVKQLVAAPASLSFQVYAAASEKEASKKNVLKVDELSLYTSPAAKSKYVEDPRTQLEEGIGHVRHSLEPYTGWFQDFSGKAKPKVEMAAEYGREGYDLLKNPPPGFYPRLGVIGFAGVIGLFLARGSKVKRFVYPVSFIGICASLYYPQQAIAIGKVTGSQLYNWSLQAYINIESLWKDTPKKKKSAKTSDKADAERDKMVKVQEEKAIK